MRSKLLAALGLSLLAGGTAPAAYAQSTASATRSLSKTSVQQAAQQHPQVVDEFGGTVDARLNDYVANIGRKVATQTNVTGGGSAYTFTTLNSPVLNAFAVPGGYVYVTRQLIGIMNDEAELASVLGHEMGHVAAHHGQQRQTRSTIGSLGALLVGVVTGSQAATQLFGQAAQTYLLSYSRSQENEADKLGERYIAGAGYDPYGAPRMLASLGASTALDDRINGRNQRAVPGWASTHPLSAERVKKTNAQAATLTSPRATYRNRDQFLAAIDGMIFDDDPKQGVIDGRRFLHPVLGLKFTAPEGYAMQNGAKAVTIAGSGGQAQFSGGGAASNLDSYINQVFRALAGSQGQLNLSEPRRTNVNGMPAAYVTTRASTQQSQVDVTVFAYQWDNSRAYHFITITPAGSGLGSFSSMVQSLTRLSSGEAAAIRPRILDVIAVRSGDTVQSLAGRMAYNDYRLERFLTLNGLAPNAQFTPGQKVKIIVYG
jgi:predicted Zn-dependent protease